MALRTSKENAIAIRSPPAPGPNIVSFLKSEMGAMDSGSLVSLQGASLGWMVLGVETLTIAIRR